MVKHCMAMKSLWQAHSCRQNWMFECSTCVLRPQLSVLNTEMHLCQCFHIHWAFWQGMLPISGWAIVKFSTVFSGLHICVSGRSAEQYTPMEKCKCPDRKLSIRATHYVKVSSVDLWTDTHIQATLCILDHITTPALHSTAFIFNGTAGNEMH